MRTAANFSTQSTVIEPGDEPDEPPSEEDDVLGQVEFRLLYARRAIMQIDKSMQELQGIAEAFTSIRLQLINNRIDAEDRKARIKLQVESPLRNILDAELPALRDSVVQLESDLVQLEQSAQPAEQSQVESDLQLAIQRIDVVLTELNQILDSLIKYETQNELLEIVRRMIQQQREILEKTEQERQRQAFESLLD